MTEDNLLSVNIEIPFSSKRIAEIVYHVLRVDTEPKNSITKEVNCSDNRLIVKFHGTSPKKIRVAVNSFFENVNLISETIDCFSDNISDTYSYF